jgi:TatD DNase family protein
MLHIRDAYEDSLSVLKQYPKARGNVHFFAGDYETAKKFIDIGFTLSFTGVITFTNSYDEVIKNIPLNMIMSETDSPFVAPIPYRGKRNEPIYVKEVVKKIAEIRGEDIEKVKTAIIANTKRVFDF